MDNKELIDILKQLVINTAPKKSYSILLTSNTAEFTTTLSSVIRIESENWGVGLVSLETYNSIPNITASNNVFRYSTDNGLTWKVILLAIGSYEITAINAEIQRQINLNGDSPIDITANVSTLGSAINIPTNNRVDFTVDNSIGSTLGFNSCILSSGYNISPRVVNILTVNSILVNCDIISGSYLNGHIFPTIYSFFPNVNPGYKIVERPINIQYLPITSNDIFSIRLWLTDQNGKKIDLRGETLTVRLELKHL